MSGPTPGPLALRTFFQNVRGLTSDKDDALQRLMDAHALDILFLTETHRAPTKKDEKISFISRAGHVIIEMTNPNLRRGIQFRIASHLEPLLVDCLCWKSQHLRP